MTPTLEKGKTVKNVTVVPFSRVGVKQPEFDPFFQGFWTLFAGVFSLQKVLEHFLGKIYKKNHLGGGDVCSGVE